MVSGRIFTAVYRYFLGIFHGVRAVIGSSFAVVPYLLGFGGLRKEVTEQYPDPVSSKTEDDLPPRFRGLLYNDIEKCTGCGDCARACPSQCITLDAEQGASTNKMWVAQFDIDFSRCVFCGICVDVCEPSSLSHTRQFEAAVYEPSRLIKNFGRGTIAPELREKWARLRELESSELLFPRGKHT